MGKKGHCQAYGCQRHLVFAWIDDIKIKSLYCQEHTCQGPRSALNGFCARQRDPTAKFCLVHGECKIQGCSRQAPREIDREDFPWTCYQREFPVRIIYRRRPITALGVLIFCNPKFLDREMIAQEEQRKAEARRYQEDRIEAVIRAEVERRLRTLAEEEERRRRLQEQRKADEEKAKKEFEARVDAETAKREAAREARTAAEKSQQDRQKAHDKKVAHEAVLEERRIQAEIEKEQAERENREKKTREEQEKREQQVREEVRKELRHLQLEKERQDQEDQKRINDEVSRRLREDQEKKDAEAHQKALADQHDAEVARIAVEKEKIREQQLREQEHRIQAEVDRRWKERCEKANEDRRRFYGGYRHVRP